MKTFCITVAVVAVIAAAPQASADPPAAVPLTGESFEGEHTGTCQQTASGRYTFTFEASGAAVGPYPGTFTETGVARSVVDVTTGAQSLTYFRADFTVRNATGQVTVIGTKRLAPATTGFLDCPFAYAAFGGQAVYRARAGGGEDHGTSTVQGYPGQLGYLFEESFVSTGPAAGNDGDADGAFDENGD